MDKKEKVIKIKDISKITQKKVGKIKENIINSNKIKTIHKPSKTINLWEIMDHKAV